jgi:4-deoxy-L-threo-5-hexosulose-uronate ketol-isomerase
MQVRYVADGVRFQRMTTDELRKAFLVDELFEQEQLQLLYVEVDRCIVGSAVPGRTPLALQSARELSADYFCERRELGVLNIGAKGTVTADGEKYVMESKDGLYIGRGTREILFSSDDPDHPALFYLVSFPAHTTYPTRHAKWSDAEAQKLGSAEGANARTIYRYIHERGIQSCQLVMGFTVLEPGSVWNTMPPHTHERRMEVYLYFDMEPSARVFHLMGSMQETRHLVIANRQAVISPSWSIHSGVGTSRYTFCWGMGGENQRFEDMDGIEIGDLR